MKKPRKPARRTNPRRGRKPDGPAISPVLSPEETLRRLEKVIETMQLGVTITDCAGRILYVNAAEAALHGYTAEELIGKDVGIYAPGAKRRPLSSTELVDFSRWQREVVNIRKDGTSFPVRLLSDVVLDSSGIPIGVITTCEDITDREAAARALQEARDDLERRVQQRTAALRDSEERYRDLVEHSLGLICSHDLRGVLQSVNPAAATLLGYAPEELVGANMESMLSPDTRSLFKDYLSEIRRNGVSAGLMRVVTRTGEERTWAYRNVLNQPAGAEPYVVGHAQDVTEQRLLEAQLRQAQKMEAIGQLTGGIAHDFNNLLTVILANAELMAESELNDPETRTNAVIDIQVAARRGAEMIRKLLAFSRRGGVAVGPVELGKLMTEVSGMLRRMLPASIAIRVIEEAGLGPALADAGAVQQILLNLATNSRDAMPGGGTLTVETAQCLIEKGSGGSPDVVAPGEYALITVRDTGAGMDEETRARVFEPFFTTKGAGQGTGLGLAMVYGLMKQHNGYVIVDSHPGRGCAVSLYFPLADAGTLGAEAPAGPAQRPRGGTESVLVVEDEEAVRRSVAQVLKKVGYTVLVAADGQDAVDLLRTGRDSIELVIADVVMPRMGGLDLYAALRKEGNPVPVLLMSGYAPPDVQHRIRADGDMPFLQKPWTIPALLSAVRDTLDHSH